MQNRDEPLFSHRRQAADIRSNMKAEDNTSSRSQDTPPVQVKNAESANELPWYHGHAPQDPVVLLGLTGARSRAARAREAGITVLVLWFEALIAALNIEFRKPMPNYYYALIWDLLGCIAGVTFSPTLSDEAVMERLCNSIIERRELPPSAEDTGILLAISRGVFLCELAKLDADIAYRAARAFLMAADGMDRHTFLAVCQCEPWITEEMIAVLDVAGPSVN
jgi:hypothetical protein